MRESAVSCSLNRCLSTPWRVFIVLLSLDLVRSQDDAPSDALDPLLFDQGYCTTPTTPGSGFGSMREINTNTMACSKLMEFIYITRWKVWKQLDGIHTEANSNVLTPWPATLRSISRASSLLSAHVHIIAAIVSQRTECFSEHVRLLLVVNLRRMRVLSTGHFRQLWTVLQGSPDGEVSELARAWLKEASELLETDLRTMKTVLSTWHPPAPDEAQFYSHEADGRFSTMEALRRDTFKEYTLDEGLLRGLIRWAFPLDATVADLGASSGHYAHWLNDTGLVSAHAFDGSPDVEIITKGKVLNAELGKPLELWQKFDWTLCLEVAEHIPADLTAQFLRNLDANTKEGLVLSWARPGLPGIGHANPQSEADVLRLVHEHTGLRLDEGLSVQLRAAASAAHLAESIVVFTRTQRPPVSQSPQVCAADGTCATGLVASTEASLAPGCAAEDGWIYAGNDVQTFSSVTSAAACCDLCKTHESCRFWTWSQEDSHKDMCWIKATREYRIAHEGFVSGAREAI